MFISLISLFLGIDFTNMKILSPVEKLDENVDLSSVLWSASRVPYPKIAKKCKTDQLLSRRMQLKIAEERSLMTKNTTTPKSSLEVNIQIYIKTTIVVI